MHEVESLHHNCRISPSKLHLKLPFVRIPRFDYNALSSFLRRSQSGFLVTCTIKREKSATKEAMCLLEKVDRPRPKDCCSKSLFLSL
ncbi:hypothetical protein NL676_038054 [Syzygium grande]|nr:hypothetical protein NL676_038054 [Syzygium grande]